MSATLTPQKKTKRKATISSGQNTLHSVAEQDTIAPIETEEAERIQRLKEAIPQLQELTVRLIEEGKLKPFINNRIGGTKIGKYIKAPKAL